MLACVELRPTAYNLFVHQVYIQYICRSTSYVPRICANCLDLTCSCGAGEAVREGHQRGEREGAHREALQPALAANEQGGAAHLPTLGGLTVRWHVMYVTSQLIGLLKYYTTICNYFKLISGYGI